jgi:hypothetical protein
LSGPATKPSGHYSSASAIRSIDRPITDGIITVIYSGNTGEMSLLRVIVMLTPR